MKAPYSVVSRAFDFHITKKEEEIALQDENGSTWKAVTSCGVTQVFDESGTLVLEIRQKGGGNA